MTTKRADLEGLDLSRRRLDEATQYLTAELLALSPQCGFGGLDSISIPEQDRWCKFERMSRPGHVAATGSVTSGLTLKGAVVSRVM